MAAANDDFALVSLSPASVPSCTLERYLAPRLVARCRLCCDFGVEHSIGLLVPDLAGDECLLSLLLGSCKLLLLRCRFLLKESSNIDSSSERLL